MLISPSKIHSILTSLLSSSPSPSSSSSSADGPHTALLIYPNGQLVSSACIPLDDSATGSESESQNHEQGGANNDDNTQGEDEDEEDGDEDEEPYLEIQERRRLLLGLASQWGRDDSGKMECELGKLHFTWIALPPPDNVSSIGKESLPAVKSQVIDGFILVLNATKDVDWKVLVQKSEEFKKQWAS
ncbi:uncharacterized protein I303_107441 [Kwoniella dejecticola CBS 10117]|uniref:Uncharacterized protein n=1 Tax=Kwoniella dejecticola CBS 10117 TaxID=1296121 RepID=A0A1A5ZZQ5_9TREE|nr:uncharacterized protein I303_06845 [Kwoniella dejecticola CBS 10117]OBR83282.1 hypothetical protein I303_06845 [Kwoniella dejecticola CBS 10117]